MALTKTGAVEVTNQVGFKIKIANTYGVLVHLCTLFYIYYLIQFSSLRQWLVTRCLSDSTLQMKRLEHKWLTCPRSQSYNTALSELEHRHSNLKAHFLKHLDMLLTT